MTATNGVLHMIDTVLVPTALQDSVMSIRHAPPSADMRRIAWRQGRPKARMNNEAAHLPTTGQDRNGVRAGQQRTLRALDGPAMWPQICVGVGVAAAVAFMVLATWFGRMRLSVRPGDHVLQATGLKPACNTVIGCDPMQAPRTAWMGEDGERAAATKMHPATLETK